MLVCRGSLSELAPICGQLPEGPSGQPSLDYELEGTAWMGFDSSTPKNLSIDGSTLP